MSKRLSIDISLCERFVDKYNELQSRYGSSLAKLNGFSDSQLNYSDYIINFIDEETVADSSIDGSANSRNKDIVSLLKEMPKPHEKILAFNKIYYEIAKKYGVETADIWLELEYIGFTYMHDANTSTFVSYCFAYDLKDLAERGLYFIKQHNAEPAKHLDTFVDFVKEYINYTSNRTSGAVGLPNILVYMYYFWKKDIENGAFYGSPERHAKRQIQRVIYGVNQPYVRDGIQCAFTNTSIFDYNYLEALFGGSKFPDGTYMIDELDGIMQFQKWFLEETAAIKSKNMFTFPVNSISILKQVVNREKAIELIGKELVEELYDETDTEYHVPVDVDFAKYTVRHNMQWSDSNFFTDDNVTSLSNCCRLKSNIEDLGYFNSIGGTALKVGSVKVNTINLARIALETTNEEEYLEKLKFVININMIALDRVRHIIKRNVDKGLLNNFTYGLIDFEHLYNTVGFIGIYETMKTFGYTKVDELGNTYYTKEAEVFAKKIFDTMDEAKREFAKDKDYMVNTEQIPGETAADKLMRKDLYFHKDRVVTDLPLYGNQFIPLGIKTTLNERIRIASMFDSFCNGGSILHINIDSPFDNFDKAWKMFLYTMKMGITYHANNTKINSCKHNHAFYGPVCPECGEGVETEWTRIVGFYTPVNGFSKPRKDEYYLREWEPVNNEN